MTEIQARAHVSRARAPARSRSSNWSPVLRQQRAAFARERGGVPRARCREKRERETEREGRARPARNETANGREAKGDICIHTLHTFVCGYRYYYYYIVGER